MIYEPIARNFKLLAHHELDGFGGMGEGMSIQIAKDGRRILWLAHESAPKNFTGVDVSDPGAPKVVVQTDLPHFTYLITQVNDAKAVEMLAWRLRDDRSQFDGETLTVSS